MEGSSPSYGPTVLLGTCASLVVAVGAAVLLGMPGPADPWREVTWTADDGGRHVVLRLADLPPLAPAADVKDSWAELHVELRTGEAPSEPPADAPTDDDGAARVELRTALLVAQSGPAAAVAPVRGVELVLEESRWPFPALQVTSEEGEHRVAGIEVELPWSVVVLLALGAPLEVAIDGKSFALGPRAAERVRHLFELMAARGVELPELDRVRAVAAGEAAPQAAPAPPPAGEQPGTGGPEAPSVGDPPPADPPGP